MSRDIYNIISDYLCGKISPEDRKTFDLWISSSVENQEMYEEIEKVWKLTGKLSADLHPNIDLEWEHFKILRNKPSKSKSIILNPIFLRVAAVLIPVIVASLLFIYKTNNENYLTVTSGNEEVLKTLSDGSEVLLNKNSTLIFPEKFKKKQRVVKISGEAYFKIVKSKNPFIVETGQASVKVLGTKFIVRNYNNEKQTEVFVEEGKVLFFSQNLKNKALLTGGEKAVLTENSILLKEKITSDNSFSWVKEKLVFEETPLKELKSDVLVYFGKTLILPPHLENCLFTGEFSDPSVNEVMDIVSLTFDSAWEMKNDSIFILGGSCKEQ